MALLHAVCKRTFFQHNRGFAAIGRASGVESDHSQGAPAPGEFLFFFCRVHLAYPVPWIVILSPMLKKWYSLTRSSCVPIRKSGSGVKRGLSPTILLKRRWLDRLAKQLANRAFANDGGIKGLDKRLGGQLNNVINEFTAHLWDAA